MLVLLVIAHVMLSKTRFGRYTYAVGSNEISAKFSGIKVERHLILVYLISGFVSAVAGVIMVCRLNSGVSTAGDGYEMNSIAAAVIGGASLAGGRGAVTGTLLGTVLMVLITNAGTAFKIDPYILDVTTGVLIIFAVAMDMMKSRKKG